jgi:pimeloyl-ACP methyl ester carboxylesterase
MATFILVHGTFAKPAHWPMLQHSLAETARSAGHEPAFEWLPWTGRNRAKARQTAASEISALVQRILRTSANERIFIIGHSHGGSAIAYFLKELPEAAKTLAGCAFLSTPFVAIRPRKEAVGLIAVLLLFPFFTFLGIWNEIMRPHSSLPPDTPFANVVMDDLAQAPVYVLGVVIAAMIGFLIWSYFKRASAPEKLKQSIRQQTADIPIGNYLFLRCSGDEAAAALSAAQFIAWLSMKVSTILKLLTRSLFDEGKIGTVSWLVVFLFLLPTIAHGLLQVLPGFVNFVIHYGHSSLPGNLYSALSIYKLISLVIVSLLLVCLLAVSLIVVTQAVTSWTFGWTRLSTGFLVELAIEPLPFGEHSLVHIDWAANSIGLDGYVHSWTYAHPDALKHLQNWVRASLRNCP